MQLSSAEEVNGCLFHHRKLFADHQLMPNQDCQKGCMFNLFICMSRGLRYLVGLEGLNIIIRLTLRLVFVLRWVVGVDFT